jgi:hypothetical protein
MSEQPRKPKSLVEQAIEQLPENELHGKVTTDDGQSIDGKLSVQKTWKNGVGFGFFVEGKFQIGRKPQGAAGLEIKKKFNKSATP